MLQARVIPCLLLMDDGLVKTVRFKDPSYIGDPINTVRIFNELEVDEICFLDIRATLRKQLPSLTLLRHISDECFCPLSYGGGINSLEAAQKIFATGFEKIIINTAAHENPALVTAIAEHYGSQAVVAAIDIKKNLWGKNKVWTHSGTIKTDQDPVTAARKMEAAGAGELLITPIDHESSWSGLDIPLIKQITDAVDIPVIAQGGAGEIAHISAAIREGGASAVGLGSMVVYQKKGMGVLVNFPDRKQLEAAIRK